MDNTQRKSANFYTYRNTFYQWKKKIICVFPGFSGGCHATWPECFGCKIYKPKKGFQNKFMKEV